MSGLGEEINRGKTLGAVALGGQEGKIAGHGFRIAADIDHPFGGHAGHALNELGGGAFAGRVHENDICPLPGGRRFCDPLGGIGGKEAGVFHVVVLCVADGIPDSVPVQLYAHHLLCPAAGGQTDGANAAVGIQHHLFAGQAGGFHSQTIQHLGLVMVDLVEAPGAQGIGLAAEGIQNETLAVERLFLFAQHHAGAAGVVVLHHGGHGDMALFGFGQQGADKVFCPGQNRLGCYQYHHHLPGHHAAPQQAVAEQAGAFVLVEGLVAAGVGGGADGQHHLVQYLVLQKGEKVTHKDLTDTLWNGERSTNPDMALRAIMHRFRNMIEAEGLKELETCIITSRGYYQWNPTMECRVDVFEMEALMEEARRQLNPAAAVARYERVLELYAGRLLPMSCNEPWVETRSLTLHVQYRIALFQVLEACKRKGENERIVKLCRRAIELDPYEERLYLEMIQALEALGRHEQALEMTRRGNAMGCLHHAVEPERVGVVSRQARQADRNLENDISRLAEELSADDTPGAAYCSFENFRQIYHLQRGVQSRFGVPVYLALLTMSPAQNADPAETGSMMEQLGELIHKSLRQCDAMARYSENQYVLLISGNSSAENGSTPLERIKAAFYRVPAHGRYLLNYHMYAPELHALSADARRR